MRPMLMWVAMREPCEYMDEPWPDLRTIEPDPEEALGRGRTIDSRRPHGAAGAVVGVQPIRIEAHGPMVPAPQQTCDEGLRPATLTIRVEE